MKVLVLNGPNLARLDIRDSKHYGDLNWAQLKELIEKGAKDLGFEADVRQSDDEATIVGWLHEAEDKNIPVIINPAAFTHYSVAIHDAAEIISKRFSCDIKIISKDNLHFLLHMVLINYLAFRYL